MSGKKEKPNTRRGVLICGAYGHGNAGDEAILEAIVGEMRAIDPDMPVTVLSRTPGETAARNGVRALHTFDFPAFLRVMRRSKLFLCGGGSLIQDVTSSRSLWYYLFTLRAARLLGCRVLMYGCGIGPVTRAFDRRLTRRVLNKSVDVITLREESSLDELREYGVTVPEVIPASDPALTLPAAEPEAAEAALAELGIEPGTKCIGVCVRRWPGFLDRTPAFAEALRHAWEVYGLTPVFVSINHRSDGEAAERVCEKLPAGMPRFLLREPMPTPLTIAVLSRMDIVLSMRLHGLIFAAASGVPLAGVSYDPKVTAFLEYAGQKNHLPLEKIDAQSLCALVDAAAALRGARAALAARARELREKESRNTMAARRLLES